MAPNAFPFFNFNLDKNAILIHKNISNQFHYNNYSSRLFKNRLKTTRENFAAVNSYFLKENYIEPVDSVSFSSVTEENKNENEKLEEMCSIAAQRLELIRRILVKQTIKDKMEMWQKKKEEMSRNRSYETSPKPKFQREDIGIKKENYKLVLDQIKKRTTNEQTNAFNYLQRSREICFKAVLAKAVSTASVINNYFNNEQLVLIVGEQIAVYRSLESRLDVLKNTNTVEEVPLSAAQSLLEDLILYKDNVVIPNQAEIETNKANLDNKRNYLFMFSVNKPDNSLLKHIKRQYVALVKNNKSLIQNLTNVQSLPFINDPSTNLFRQNVIKVINTLVNTISSTNVAHLTEKYDKLNMLLNGKLVCVANAQVMIGENKEALAFCMETLASKIISHAEEVICVKTQVAYEIAAVTIKLWNAHPNFGKILYAKIKQVCPLLVPFCHPVAKCLTNGQYNTKAFGYKIDSSGNVESHDKYLRRMTGIVRLYAALIAVSSKHDKPVIGLSQAWIFVAGTLNQNPVADITATMLVEFLSNVGFTMHQAYGRQFIKLLQYIDTCYLEKITLVTPTGNGGPITRLNNFISKSLSVGSIEEPKSMLPFDFF